MSEARKGDLVLDARRVDGGDKRNSDGYGYIPSVLHSNSNGCAWGLLVKNRQKNLGSGDVGLQLQKK